MNGLGVTLYASRDSTDDSVCADVLGLTTWETYRVTVTGRDNNGNPGARSEEIQFLARDDGMHNYPVTS